MLLAVLIAHRAATEPSPSPYAVKNVRCLVAGQVALERTAADCRRLQVATTKAATTPEAPKTLTLTRAPQATAPAPTKTAVKQPTTQPAKTVTHPTYPVTQPTVTKPGETKPQPAASNPVVTYCAHFGPGGATTTNGPCGSGGGHMPAGFQAYLCRVEHRTDGFCQGG